MKAKLVDILSANERTKAIHFIADIKKPIAELTVDELACLTFLLEPKLNSITPSEYKAPDLLKLLLARCDEKGLEVF